MTVNLSRGKYRFSLLLNFFPIVNTDLHLNHSELEENLSGKKRGKTRARVSF